MDLNSRPLTTSPCLPLEANRESSRPWRPTTGCCYIEWQPTLAWTTMWTPVESQWWSTKPPTLECEPLFGWCFPSFRPYRPYLSKISTWIIVLWDWWVLHEGRITEWISRTTPSLCELIGGEFSATISCCNQSTDKLVSCPACWLTYVAVCICLKLSCH